MFRFTIRDVLWFGLIAEGQVPLLDLSRAYPLSFSCARQHLTPARIGQMNSKWQFSLRYLLLEIFLFGVSFGLFRAAVKLHEYGIFLLLAGATTTDAAVGGMTGHMVTGAIIGLALALIAGCLLLPAVMTA